jgi:hypothetical protein
VKASKRGTLIDVISFSLLHGTEFFAFLHFVSIPFAFTVSGYAKKQHVDFLAFYLRAAFKDTHTQSKYTMHIHTDMDKTHPHRSHHSPFRAGRTNHINVRVYAQPHVALPLWRSGYRPRRQQGQCTLSLNQPLPHRLRTRTSVWDDTSRQLFTEGKRLASTKSIYPSGRPRSMPCNPH